MGVIAQVHEAVICVRPDFMLSLLDEIGRTRALADHETDLVEDIVKMGTPVFRWNARTDRALLTAAHSPGGIARFARRHNITGEAAYCRLKRIRKSQKRPSAPTRRKG